MATPKTYLLIAIASMCLVLTSQARAQGIQVTPGALVFPDAQPLGDPFPAMLSVAITNTGTQPLVVTSATLAGDFTFASGTPTQSITIGTVFTSVIFGVLFNPTAPGPRTGTLTLVDNAPGSPHTIQISGTGFSGAMIQGQKSLDLQSTQFGPLTWPLTIFNVGDQPATITSLAVSGNGFSQTNNCGVFATQGESCQINLTYNPPAPGPQSGTITIANNGVVNPLTITLLADAGGFHFTTDPAKSAATVLAGQKASFPFSVGGLGFGQGLGFDSITFSCNGLPAGASCMAALDPSFVPPPSPPPGFAFTAPAVLTISTTSRTLGALRPLHPGWGWSFAAIAALAFMPRCRRKPSTFLAVLMATAMLGAVVSCGGGASVNSNGTPAGTYSITVSGTRSGLTQSFPVLLNVQ